MRIKDQVLMHKKTGRLVELFETFLGLAITKVDLRAKPNDPLIDIIIKGQFYFSDDHRYNLNDYENLGDL